jgi:hypothetical protein
MSVLQVSRAALTTVPAPSVAADVANGNFCLNDGFTVLVLLNTDSSGHTLTVSLASGVDGATAGPKSYPVLVTADRQWVGPFPLLWYGSQLNFNLDSALVKVQPVSLLSA